ncbi:MAG TPA: acyl-CoA dehydrogenase family protein [Isosphaeraceae bacterium]|jgi:alkylation response protein AidB-like acyl-CoA dehydrogenase|nr:acyl-CoA dehydrogenase family protein [Isosphaeraceae bacterium]
MPPDETTIPDWPGPSTGAEGLAEVVGRLAAADPAADEAGDPAIEGFWRPLAEAGAPRWSLPTEFGGEGCDRPTLVRRYGRVAEGSLTAAFVLTQHDAAVRRLVPAALAGSGRASEWLGAIAAGRAFATVGISHLTTSRRRGPRALVAVEVPGGYRLDGLLPWVTAAPRATVFVAGAALDDGRQLLFALPADRPGVAVRAPFELAALQASGTCEVACDGVAIAAADVLAGPSPDVMATPGAAGTGGLETSALALGQARAALVALAALAPDRDELAEPIEALAATWGQLADDLVAAAEGRPDAPPAGMLRARANAFVLRASQAYLTARKGTGFLRGEAAQRWARQALFFLVWSCPTPVARAALRDFAGLCG